MKPNYLLIPLVTVVTAMGGSWITNLGLSWYDRINLPAWTPAGSVIGAVWTIIFVLATISALLVYNLMPKSKKRRQLMSAFLINAVLNVGWSALFFGGHFVGWAIIEAAVLALSVLVLIVMIWARSKAAAVMLVPYFAWVCFATYLTYSVWSLNR
jgi:tryptophan-rich sensory protein